MVFSETEKEYYQVIGYCREIFEKKTNDYGTSWRILRLSSVTDQIYIKAQRIRSIQEKGIQKIEDGVVSEFMGIINYCIIGLIQIELANDSNLKLPTEQVTEFYNKYVEVAVDLLRNKNHDYGEAWRNMRVSSMTDLILMKILRIKQIEDHQGMTLISEGIDANYLDILNYSVFCIIRSR